MGQFNNGFFAFANNNKIKFGIKIQGFQGAEADMGATHDGNDIRINLFHILDNADGIVKCHRNRSQSDEIRLEIAYFGLKGFCIIRINNKIKQFYVYPGIFQYSGQKCQAQRRRRGFGKGGKKG